MKRTNGIILTRMLFVGWEYDVVLRQRLPLFGGYLPVNDRLGLTQHHAQLGYRILSVRWNGEAMILIHHKLMPGPGKQAFETEFMATAG